MSSDIVRTTSLNACQGDIIMRCVGLSFHHLSFHFDAIYKMFKHASKGDDRMVKHMMCLGTRSIMTCDVLLRRAHSARVFMTTSFCVDAIYFI